MQLVRFLSASCAKANRDGRAAVIGRGFAIAPTAPDDLGQVLRERVARKSAIEPAIGELPGRDREAELDDRLGEQGMEQRRLLASGRGPVEELAGGEQLELDPLARWQLVDFGEQGMMWCRWC